LDGRLGRRSRLTHFVSPEWRRLSSPHANACGKHAAVRLFWHSACRLPRTAVVRPPHRPAPAFARPRPARPRAACKQRRTKCDGQQPCEGCVKRACASCGSLRVLAACDPANTGCGRQWRRLWTRGEGSVCTRRERHAALRSDRASSHREAARYPRGPFLNRASAVRRQQGVRLRQRAAEEARSGEFEAKRMRELTVFQAMGK
jgi:hypothetical protein